MSFLTRTVYSILTQAYPYETSAWSIRDESKYREPWMPCPLRLQTFQKPYNLHGGKGRAAHKTDNLTAIYKPFV
jgi:hypothetical protein